MGKHSTDRRLGKTQRKVLLLLLGGLGMGLSYSPKQQLRIVRGMIAGWKEINGEHFTRTVESLYRSKLVSKKAHKDGSYTLTLTDEGRKYALRFHLDTLPTPKQKRWDGKWRVVLYDIPESKRRLRLELKERLENLGFVELQHSVFAHPYECTDQIEFLIEAYDARPYVRRMLVEKIDISEPLRVAFLRRQKENAKNHT
jgi:hypothetical protein